MSKPRVLFLALETTPFVQRAVDDEVASRHVVLAGGVGSKAREREKPITLGCVNAHDTQGCNSLPIAMKQRVNIWRPSGNSSRHCSTLSEDRRRAKLRSPRELAKSKPPKANNNWLGIRTEQYVKGNEELDSVHAQPPR
jgi:hypothetical protein